MAGKNNEVEEKVKKGICPQCGRKLSHEEGCVECGYCGWSLCDEA